MVTTRCGTICGRFLLFAWLATSSGDFCRLAADDPATAPATAPAPPPVAKPDPTRGTISGTVTYRADPNRPWRLSRYYIKRVRTGEVAEAVVALRGRNLKDQASGGAQTVTIDQKDYQFSPETTAIRVGDTIKFTNSDGATHNVQSTNELAEFNVTMAQGGSHSVTFSRAGGTRNFLRIGCVFHSAMQAFIFVFDHPFFAVTAADGKFRLVNIPPGEYDLELAHAAGELRWKQHVVVTAGQTQQIDIRLSADDKR